jgi:drug/metabolite transporter (DMT)-like permease
MRQQPVHDSFNTTGGLVAILLWSATFALARSLAERVGPLTAAASVHFVGGALCLLPLLWRQRAPEAPRKLSHRYLFGCGSLFVLYTALIYLAVGLAKDREQVLEIALVNYLWPAGTILFSLPLLRHRASLLLLPGTALALAGVFLVMTQGDGVSWPSFVGHLRGNPAAYLCALVAAIAWALYSNLARRWTQDGDRGAVEWFILATGVILLLMRLVAGEQSVWSALAMGETLLLGAITALAYALWDGAMRRGNLLLVVVCSYGTPLLSTLVSCAYLKVVPGPQLWVGCLLLVAGSLISWRSVAEPAADQA